MFRPCERPDRKPSGQSGAEAGKGKMAAAAVAEFQRAQSLLGTDRNASIDILHSIGKYVGRNMALEGKKYFGAEAEALLHQSWSSGVSQSRS